MSEDVRCYPSITLIARTRGQQSGVNEVRESCFNDSRPFDQLPVQAVQPQYQTIYSPLLARRKLRRANTCTHRNLLPTSSAKTPCSPSKVLRLLRSSGPAKACADAIFAQKTGLVSELEHHMIDDAQDCLELMVISPVSTAFAIILFGTAVKR